MDTKSKKITYKHILATVFCVIIFFFFITVCERFVRSSVLKQDISGATAAEQNNASDGSVNIEEPDWQALYPFKNKIDANTSDDDDRSPSEAEETPKKQTDDNGIVKIIRSIEGKIDYYTTELVFGRMNFIELNLIFKCMKIRFIIK